MTLKKKNFQKMITVPYDVTGIAMQNIILGMAPEMGDVRVSRSGGSNNKYQWDISFIELAGDIEPIKVDSHGLHSNLPGDSSVVTADEIRKGTWGGLEGSFILKSFNKTDLVIAVDATVEEMTQLVSREYDTLNYVVKHDSDVNGAVTWDLVFHTRSTDIPAPVVTVDSNGMSGSGAKITLTRTTASVAEVQSISMPLGTTGEVTCTTSIGTFGLSFSSSADYLSSVLSLVFSNESFEVSRVDTAAAREWMVTFVDRVGDVSDLLISCASPISVSTSVDGTGVDLAGTFTIQNSDPISCTASASDVKAALTGLLPAVDVSRSVELLNGGYVYDITFGGSNVKLDVRSAGLSGTNAFAEVTEVVQVGSSVQGTFVLNFDNEYTEPISASASALTMKHKLEQLQKIRHVDVSRLGPDEFGGLEWTITFSTFVEAAFTINWGPQPPLVVSDEDRVIVQVVQMQVGDMLPSLTADFTLAGASFSFAIDPVQLLDQQSVSTQLRSGLETLLPGTPVKVTQIGPDVLGDTTWEIELPWDNRPYSTMVVGTIVGAASGYTISRVPIQKAEDEIGGWIRIGRSGHRTTLVALNVSTSDLEAALLSSTVVTGSVSAQRVDNYTWDISYEESSSSTTPLLSVDSSGLTGPGDKAVTVSFVHGSDLNEVQLVDVGAAVDFVIRFPDNWLFYHDQKSTTKLFPTTVELDISMDAAAIESKLNDVLFNYDALRFDDSAKQYVRVEEVTSSSWRISSLLVLGDLDPLECEVATVTTEQDGTSRNIGEGTFRLKLKNKITNSIPFNADVDEILSEIGDGSVHLTHLDPYGGREWRVTFSGDDLSLFSSELLEVQVSALRHGNFMTVGAVPVEVSLNGVDYSRASNLFFKYTPMVNILGLYPNHGLSTGGTKMIVIGEYFEDTTFACLFENDLFRQVVNAYVVNSTALICTSPPRFATDSVRVQVGSHNNVFSASTTADFLYEETIVTRIVPREAPAGVLVNFTVYGSGFSPSDNLQCRFGGTLLVTARWTSSNVVHCLASLDSNVVALFELSNNGVDFVRNHRVEIIVYQPLEVSDISPIAGPRVNAGTEISIYGKNFANTASLSCRFDITMVVPAVYVNPTVVRCRTPPNNNTFGYLALDEHSHQDGSQMFPLSHSFPLYHSRLVDLEISNNGHDFHTTNRRFLYQDDLIVTSVVPLVTFLHSDMDIIEFFVSGVNFVNSTLLTCRLGIHHSVKTVFITSELILCFHKQAPAAHYVIEVSNNGWDFSTDFNLIETKNCPSGYYCPSATTQICPPGAYCPMNSGNFTLCPKGTYQPQSASSDCRRCPIGYACPQFGMSVPRICPAGFVCDVTGVEVALMPCPEGHFCLEGTATTATTCGDPSILSAELTFSTRYKELKQTMRKKRFPEGGEYVYGSRNSACWNNGTSDFGLQVSPYPMRFWMERHLLPLDPNAPFEPLRGRFCMDDSCMRLDDAEDVRAVDYSFDYQHFNLRRPVPCPAGTYCAPGTAVGDTSVLKNFSSPQPCSETMYCPEGSASSTAFTCPIRFFCPFGIKKSCPVGSYCPKQGLDAPLPCPPSTFNAMVGQSQCTECPAGYICPGFGRVDPVICPAGYVCSIDGLLAPDLQCPAGFYCNNGTLTVDPFRNDTTLRPYPCSPGTYCIAGVGFSSVMESNFLHAQPCFQGFYCESGSTSPKGAGLCPKGFVCPKGTAVPVPTSPGTFAEMEGTVQVAQCLPGYYAPTIETVTCYPCPAGTMCTNDGTAEALLCPPGTYKVGTQPGENVVCKGCPHGTWSKNWELRDESECTFCPPGVVCSTDGAQFPCSYQDMPTPYMPTGLGESEYECLQRGEDYYYGYLKCPLDDLLRSPYFESSSDAPGTSKAVDCPPYETSVQCYENFQPVGSKVYQRMKDFHGPRYEIQSGGVYHQGYGDDKYEGYFGRGSLYIDHPVSREFLRSRNCTSGYWSYDVDVENWIVGTCEADIICAYDEKPQAQPCSEGYVCDQNTNAMNAMAVFCADGYVCDFGSTPDLNLEAPNGRYKKLCDAGYYCPTGTGAAQATSNKCPVGYFCPTGTSDPYAGLQALDSLRRELPEDMANPFLNMLYVGAWEGFEARNISAHDDRCFHGINETARSTFDVVYDEQGIYDGVLSRAIANDLNCARDHYWSHVVDTGVRKRCDCATQKTRFLKVLQMWRESNTVRTQTYDFSYTANEKDFILSRNLCSLTLDPRFCYPTCTSVECVCGVSPDIPAPVGSVEELEEEQQVKDIALCKLFKYRNDDSRGILRSTSFYNFEDLKAFVYSTFDTTTNVVVDPGENIAGRLSVLHDIVYEADDDVYQGAFQTQLQLKRDCVSVDTCTYIDSLLYDLYMAVRFIEEFQPNASDFLSSSDRMDTCFCQDLLRCPDGTTSYGGSSSVYDCIKTGSQVLIRTMPVTSSNPLINMTGWEDTLMVSDRKANANELYQENQIAGVGTVALQALDVAVITLDLRDIMRNLTYDKHYQLAVYIDCMPCAVRRTCSGSATDTCCTCKPYSLPYYFEDNSHRYPSDYPDNKHALVQVSISPVRDVNVFFCLELLDGLYYGQFYDITPQTGDIIIHKPSRANAGTRDAFVSMILMDDFADMELPLNLPISMNPIDGVYDIEETTFIDRVARVYIGDPDYGVRSNMYFNDTRRRLQQTLNDVLGVDVSTGFSEEEIEYVPLDPRERISRDSSWWQGVENGKGIEFMAMHYFPFWSNCREYDSHMYISKALETNPMCNHVPTNSTLYVGQYPWEKLFTANSDECRLSEEDLARLYYPDSFCTSVLDCESKEHYYPGIRLSCEYEETIFSTVSKIRWYEAPGDTTLFHLSRFPVPVTDFTASGAAGWGRRGVLESLIGSEDLIPVLVESDYGGEPGLVPRQVFFNLGYYQRTVDQKSIVDATVRFEDLCSISDNPAVLLRLAKRDPPVLACSPNTTYTLFFKWSPYGYLALFNQFQFRWDLYGIFFVTIGATSVVGGFVIWFVSLLGSRLRHPPAFKFFPLYRIIAGPSLRGTVYATIPVAVGLTVIYIWFELLASNDLDIPSTVNFEGIRGDWQDVLVLTSSRQRGYSNGRIGTCFLIFGLYLFYLVTKLVLPRNRFKMRYADDRAKHGHGKKSDYLDDSELEKMNEKSDSWRPLFWKRSHVILACILYSLLILVLFEFSYSSYFEDNVNLIIVAFKIVQIGLDSTLEHYIRDVLIFAPFVVMYEITVMTVTMGAADFTDFVTSYVFELGLAVIERLLVAPFITHVSMMWPRWKVILKRKFTNRRKMTREHRAREELEWKKINEEIAMASEGVEPLLASFAQYSNALSALIMFPFITVALVVYNKITSIPDNYGIKETDLKFYVMFGFIIIPFTIAMDMFLLNTQELIQGFKIYEYVAYQSYRFGVREKRWQMDADTLDESVAASLQTVDNMCFSSQYYFLCSLSAWGMVLVVFGVTIHLRNDYVLFADPVLVPIVILVVLLCELFKYLFIRFGVRLGVWRLKSLEGTLDDDIAAKLAVGEGRQEDLEQERLELQAMNSERFRHRFLDRNRPWILQHLTDLLTPRTLQMPGSDGRPNIEYIRDVYNDLMNMGEGKRRPGDREDVSSDDEDEQVKQRRNWSNAPLSSSAAAIAKYWLLKARQRSAFFKLVRGYIEKQTGDSCGQCGRNQQSGVEMHAELAFENQPDPRSLDKLIAEYEVVYPGKSFDGALWQSFFRGHAQFFTRCKVCLDQFRQAELMKKKAQLVQPGNGRAARSGDISSDEDDSEDEEMYEPIVVSRSSVEGRALAKWLLAARKRLGGDFPRGDARDQMQQYAARMKRAKLNREANKKKKRTRYQPAATAALEQTGFGTIQLTAASTAILQLWVRKARVAAVERAASKSRLVRLGLGQVLENITEEDDWFYTGEFREEGMSLVQQGVDITTELKVLEDEAELAITDVQSRASEVRLRLNKEMDTATSSLEQFVQTEKNRTIQEAEFSIQEMTVTMEEKIAAFKTTPTMSAAEKTQATKEHNQQIESMQQAIDGEREKQLANLDKKLESRRVALREEISQKKRVLATENKNAGAAIMEINNKIQSAISPKESKWQRLAVIYIEKAKRKVAAKLEEEKAVPVAAAPRKKARRVTKF